MCDNILVNVLYIYMLCFKTNTGKHCQVFSSGILTFLKPIVKLEN